MNAEPGAVSSRPFSGDRDWWLVRQLLVRTCRMTPPDFNWDIRRWDGKRYHRPGGALPAEWMERVRLWVNGEGELVGAVHPEGRGDAYLEIHPDFRAGIEEEMIAWAEDHLAVEADGAHSLELFVYDYDAPRARLLAERGYQKTGDLGVTRRMRMGSGHYPAVRLMDGYRLRTTRPGDLEDCQRMADLLNAAFRRTFHQAQEYLTFMLHSPSFRSDLNLVAEAPDGSFAAHVGVTLDPINRRGIFEPVCTHPDHTRRHLARDLMREGLHRLADLGARDVTVDTGDMVPANALYDSLGFSEVYKGYAWRKTW